MKDNHNDEKLPAAAVEFIDLVVKKIRYRKKVRCEVRDELIDHFYMAVKECRTEAERQQSVQEVIKEFGNIDIIAKLIRRGKKRCRPLWRTVIVRTFQGIGIFILLLIFYCFWFYMGDAEPSVNYLKVFNERVKPDILAGDNAWVNYNKAIALFVKPNENIRDIRDDIVYKKVSLSELSEEEKKGLSVWMRNNKNACLEISKAADKPYCYRQYDYGEKVKEKNQWLIEILLPHVPVLRDWAKIGIIEKRFALAQGDFERAIENCVTILKVSRHWQGRKILIESIAGMRFAEMASYELIGIAKSDKVDVEVLRKALREVSDVYPEGFPELDISGEKLFIMDAIQQTFTEGGPGGGHLVPKRFIQIAESEKELLILGVGLLHAGREKTIEKVKEMYAKIEGMLDMSPYEQRINGIDIDKTLEELPEHRYFLIRSMLPALDRVVKFRFEKEAGYEAVKTILAIRLWQAEKGTLPGSLYELVEAGFIDSVPGDPYSDGALVYRVEDGNFTLYSIGSNFVDDGGVPADDRKGDRYGWFDRTGDAVFWPVQ